MAACSESDTLACVIAPAVTEFHAGVLALGGSPPAQATITNSFALQSPDSVLVSADAIGADLGNWTLRPRIPSPTSTWRLALTGLSSGSMSVRTRAGQGWSRRACDAACGPWPCTWVCTHREQRPTVAQGGLRDGARIDERRRQVRVPATRGMRSRADPVRATPTQPGPIQEEKDGTRLTATTGDHRMTLSVKARPDS